MSLLQGWRGWRAFKKLSWSWRNLVFYSESGQDWHHFEGLIGILTENLGRPVCYVTSDPSDEGLLRQHQNYRAIYIPAGLFLTIFFQVSRVDVMVLTMMDLGNLQLKRSLYPVHYIYLFHSMGSTHMVDHANSFDHYESLFCSGPHQIAEIRKREELKGLAAKHLFDYGHPRLEQVKREGAVFRERSGKHGRIKTDSGGSKPAIVLIAPTWGDDSIFNVCGEPLITELLHAGFHVIMRPHYQSIKLTPKVILVLRDRFIDRPQFEYIDRMVETDSILRSDVLISDWSAMALEYALGLEKPVLFIDVPRRIRNPDWQKLGIEPIESAIREQIGCVVGPDHLERVPGAIHQLLGQRESFIERVRALREKSVFRLGHSLPDGAAEIARLADQQLALRLQRGHEQP